MCLCPELYVPTLMCRCEWVRDLRNDTRWITCISSTASARSASLRRLGLAWGLRGSSSHPLNSVSILSMGFLPLVGYRQSHGLCTLHLLHASLTFLLSPFALTKFRNDQTIHSKSTCNTFPPFSIFFLKKLLFCFHGNCRSSLNSTL